jgi:hypothetical protein
MLPHGWGYTQWSRLLPYHDHRSMTNAAQKQQALRNRAKAKLSVIKSKLKATPKEPALADRQAERLRRLLTDYPFLSPQFDTWMDSRKEKIRQMRTRL